MTGTEPGSTRIVPVWDIPTRIFHWSLVVLIPFLWWTYQNDQMVWHKIAGFAVIALLIFRLYWGFFGAETARFSNFMRGPLRSGAISAASKRGSVEHNQR